jgi:hypothetical protein
MAEWEREMDSHTSLGTWFAGLISGGTIIASIIGYIPAFGASVAIFYYFIQIYESATVQRWLASRRTRKIARLKARVLMMEAQMKSPLPGPEAGGAASH